MRLEHKKEGEKKGEEREREKWCSNISVRRENKKEDKHSNRSIP